ncbi:hypothetical protein OEZ49_06720 [Ruegeria sp. WL0004]|uniref:Uncharacterized protein n=1 Tax=Ruegeria marisflavi TaxID=2984152 RepID=A0ABT2WNH3_9RHOB|nr:hypothetical protein [Ruegeria sp. WL0004]MCU9837454.1 hypothetical protein [Ruegeria sp. WL0004]
MITPFIKAVLIASLLVVAVGLGFAPQDPAPNPAAQLEQTVTSTGV